MPIRIATFNVENLFTRPKAMNLANQDAGTDKLKLIAELQDEMDEEVYDKARIVELANAAHGYFSINKTRGQNPLSYSRERNTHKVNVNGRKDWDGFIELTRDGFSFETIQNTGKFARALKADVLGLCEVEDRWALRRFRDDQLKQMKYTYDLLVDGNDPRRIDVAVLSTLPIGKIRTNAHWKVNPRDRFPLFSRDCLEVELKLRDGTSLWILQNHLKSKLGSPETSDKRRKAQASRVKKILEERFDLDRDYVVVCGDLNDTPDSDPLSPLLGMAKMKDVLDIVEWPAEDRWTYYYAKEKKATQIDYVLLSKALWQKVEKGGIDQRGVADVAEVSEGRVEPLEGVTSWRNAASDHGAVWVDLHLRG
jgi:endonuclease/exonuclease/phosphatase family metal-dependent hydrolase